jgi:PhnB protein
MAKAKSPVPDKFHTVTPQLVMSDASSALEWYKKALGAEIVYSAPGPGGKIMHAEMRIGDSTIMVNDEMGAGRSARALGGSPVSLWIYVSDCDALFKQAVAAGATVPPGPMGQPSDQFWGDRCGALIDPEGYTWMIATRKEDLTPDELNARAEEFFKSFAASQP